MFSGGTYEEVGRWLGNFLTSHAKRENARAEVELDSGGKREETSYAARVWLGARVSAPLEFSFSDVAQNRGSLAWCALQAARIRGVVRDVSATAA
jgi:hypothetical protein